MLDTTASAAAEAGSLSSKERRWIELACLGGSGDYDALERSLHAMLHKGAIDLAELGEFVLQFAVYCGWARAAEFERAARRQWARVLVEQGHEPRPWPLQPSGPPLLDERPRRRADIEDFYRSVNLSEPPRRDTPFMDIGVLGFVFGHVWRRPGLTLRERRILALTCSAVVEAAHPVRVHIRSALGSRDMSEQELWELLTELRAHVPGSEYAALRGALSELDQS
jgi:4-carboxymuconolactone decarboxylase